jgi:PIN domain nuclease of toxin-antitoxin system
MIVLDASALLAVIFAEHGYEKIVPFLDEAVISAVNLAEVATRLSDEGYPEASVGDLLASFQLDIRAFDETQALAVAAMRPAARKRGLSLGDRACLALGRSLDAAIFTADRAWAGLDRVELIR